MNRIHGVLSRTGGPLGVMLFLLAFSGYGLIFAMAAHPLSMPYAFVAVCNAILLIMHAFIALFIFMLFTYGQQRIYKIPLIFSYLLSVLILSYSLLFGPDVFFSGYRRSLTLNDFVLFYLLRYSGMALLFLYALYLHRRRAHRPAAIWSVSVLCLSVTVAVVLSAVLLSSHALHPNWPAPQILRISQDYHAGYRRIVLPLMCVLWGGITLLVVGCTRLKSRFWLAVMLAALTIVSGFILQWISPRVESVGWYGSLLFGLLANFWVMQIFLYDIFQRYRRVQQDYAITHNNAIRDGLTQAFNRAHYDACLQGALARCSARNPLGILMMDIDHFKLINDGYGHLSGDRVLMALAQMIAQAVRPGDVVARIGGDEFCVLLADADRATTQAVAERIRCRVAAATLCAQDGRLLSVTLSIGALVCEEAGRGAQACMALADAALYRAKQTGRNRVVLAVATA